MVRRSPSFFPEVARSARFVTNKTDALTGVPPVTGLTPVFCCVGRALGRNDPAPAQVDIKPAGTPSRPPGQR
jgi:hypothetical protein